MGVGRKYRNSIIVGNKSFDARREVGLEINVDKTKYMLLSRHQNVGQNRDLKIANITLENVSQFKYLETTVTNQNLIEEEIKRRLNFGNAYYLTYLLTTLIDYWWESQRERNH
jgi:hypothetical protein